MKAFFDKVMEIVGGKRGISVIISGILTYLTASGKVTPQTAEIVGSVAGAIGLAGVVHSNIRANTDTPPTSP